RPRPYRAPAGERHERGGRPPAQRWDQDRRRRLSPRRAHARRRAGRSAVAAGRCQVRSEAMNQRTRVAVLFGGRSDEHAVSCATAAGVLEAIDRDRYDVLPIGISRQGEWLSVSDDPARWQITDGRVPEVTPGQGHRMVLPMGERALVPFDSGSTGGRAEGVDVVLPLLHGPFGEDGTIQGMLELAGLPYVGSGVLASAVGMDKHYMKLVLAGAGLPIGDYTVITDRQWRNDPQEAARRVATLAWPVFVKPCRAGSSIGITKVDRPEDLTAAVETARAHDPKVIVEAAIEGREVECAVLQGRADAPPRSTLPGEIMVSSDQHAFYDYEAKYFDARSAGTSIGITKVDRPEDLTAAVETARAHDPKVIVEAAIEGREVECAVLQGRADAPPRSTLPGEIMVSSDQHAFYDYEAKYFDA